MVKNSNINKSLEAFIGPYVPWVTYVYKGPLTKELSLNTED